MTPCRVQLSRSKGWRKPENTIVVARPTRWGNPFRIVKVWPGPEYEIHEDDDACATDIVRTHDEARALAVALYRRLIETGHAGRIMALRGARVRPSPAEIRTLAGHNLACWCPLDQPCHADVLLELANRGAT